MFSRYSLIVLVSFSFCLSACNLEVGEKDNYNPRFKLKNVAECLDDFAKKTNMYFDGTLNTEVTEQTFTCIQHLLSRWNHLAGGSASNPYILRDWALEKLNWPKDKMDDDFVKEIMRIKQVLVGGRDDMLTRDELNLGIEFIGKFKNWAVEVQPYMRIYNLGALKDGEVVTFNDLDEAIEVLKQVSESVGEHLSGAETPYDIESMVKFMDQFREFTEWDAYNQISFSPSEFKNLFLSFKHNMVGPSPRYIAPTQWPQLMNALSSWYVMFLDYNYHLKRETISFGPGLHRFKQMVNRGFQLFETALDNQPDNFISWKQMDSFVIAAEQANLVPMGLRGETIRQSLRPLFAKVFYDRSSKSSRESLGLTKSVLKQIEVEFTAWSDAQIYMNNYLIKQGALNTERSLNPFGVDFTNQVKNIFAVDFTKEKKSRDTDPRFAEMENIIRDVGPFYRDGETRMMLVPEDQREANGVTNNIFNLTRINVFRGLIRLMFRGWAQPENFSSGNGIRESELENFYQDVRALGQDLKFMDPRACKVGSRIFKEGNLFTFIGDGVSHIENDPENFLSFNEAVEQLSFVYSSGQLREMIYNDMSKACVKPGKEDSIPTDIFGNKMINRACFLLHFKDRSKKYFDNMPGMKLYLSSLEFWQWAQVQNSLQEVAFIQGRDARWIEMGELATMSMVLHYVEAIFLHFDTVEPNGRLDPPEVWNAFERFKGFIHREAKKVLGVDFIEEKRLAAIFKYLIKEGKFPLEGGMISDAWDKIKIFTDENTNPRNDFMVDDPTLDRSQLIKILAELTKASQKNKTSCHSK